MRGFPVDELSFEAGFLNCPVWRLRDAGAAAETVLEARKRNVGLILCRLPEDAALAGRLDQAGFRKVEVLVTLACPVQKREMPMGVSLSERSEEDALACSKIGRSAFRYDRFHADPRIDDAAADALKATWVANSVRGRADSILLYRDADHRIAGFNACLYDENSRSAIIDLIGIGIGSQRKGIGTRLIDGMHAHYFGRAEEIRLGTQLANEASIAFYRRNGFEEVKREQTWHWMP